jgi:hypothetical protein
MNNSLIQKLNSLRIKSLAKEQIMSYEDLPVTFSFNLPILETELFELIKFFNGLLPEDYNFFLKYSNGCTLFNGNDLGGLEFLGYDKIIDENTFQRNNYGEDWDTNVIIFCTCLGEGNFIGFRNLGLNKYEIIDCYHEELPCDWVAIGDSLYEFMEKFIDTKGKNYWLFG